MIRNGAVVEPLRLGLQEATFETLANGSGVVSLPLVGAPLVCLDLWCRAGSAFEREEESGMAHFLEHMVFKGSSRLEAGEFDRRIEALGGCSNAATGFDDVHYHVLIPPDEAGEALDLLLDLVLRPRLDAEAFALERRVVLEELAQSEDQPEEVALQRLLALACGDHPYGRPILGRREALLRHDPAAMEAFRRRLYNAADCVLAITGAVTAGRLTDRAAGSGLAELEATARAATPAALAVTPGQHRIALPRLEAARLLMAWWQPPAADLAGVTGADLATTLLAEGRRSRMVERLREQLRIVESVDLDLHPMEGGSLALLEAICEVDRLAEVRQQIHQLWQEAIERPFSEREWDRARHLVANAYRFGLESAPGVASTVGNAHLWGRPLPLAAPLQELDRWTPDRLRREILPLLDPDRACVLEAVPA
jgi:predicted Zn-dependent peptidase